MSKIAIDRAVVEQALEALGMMSTPSPLVFLPDEIQSWQNANEALRAALEQPQDHTPGVWNVVPPGWKLVPVEPSSEMIAAGKEAMQYSLAELPAFTCYNAMLRAAPQPPTLEQSQVEQEPAIYPEEAFDMGLEAVPYYTHPQNLNCKSTQARLATLWGYIKEQPQQEQEWKRRLGNLLAVIHGDGGHYIEAHGWDKAQADAEERVARVMTGLPQSASVVWPRTASEVRAFLSGHVAAERYARDDHQPDDSDTYTLSAHDLLGAIYWWTDFDPQPRQPLTDEQITDLWIKHARSGAYIHAFVQAIERFHGIGS